MSVQTDLQAAIASTTAAIAGYAQALAADAINPEESYSLDGENVTRAEWRAGLAGMIKSLNEEVIAMQQTLNQLTPYWTATKQVLR